MGEAHADLTLIFRVARPFDVAEHFAIQDIRKGLKVPGHGLGVGVLRFQVFDDFRIAPFPQPEEGVLDLLPVPDREVGLLSSQRRPLGQPKTLGG